MEITKFINRLRIIYDNKIVDFFQSAYYFLFNQIPNFFKNIFLFKNQLWEHRNWDYQFSLSIFKRSIEILKTGMEKGHEEEISKNKKLEKINRLIFILNCFENDSFSELAEKEWNKELILDPLLRNQTVKVSNNNRSIFERARIIEKNMMNELADIIKGQDYSKFEDCGNDEDHYEKWLNQFDGSGIRGWWD